jgi:hypothetical protein
VLELRSQPESEASRFGVFVFVVRVNGQYEVATISSDELDDDAEQLPSRTDDAHVGVLIGGVMTSKSGKHGATKSLFVVRLLGSLRKVECVTTTYRFCLVLCPSVWPADVMECDLDREVLIVMPTSDTARPEPATVEAPKAMVAQLQHCAEAASVSVLEFRVGDWFTKRVAIADGDSHVEGRDDTVFAGFGGVIPRS